MNRKAYGALFALLLVTMPLLAAEDYARKPAWWDKVRVKVDRNADVDKAYAATVAGLKLERTPLEDWYVIGPLDPRSGEPTLHVYEPEKKIDMAASYAGKGGKQVSWQKWAAGKPMPIAGRIHNMVILFYKKGQMAKSFKRHVILTSDDGASLTFNGELVYNRHNTRGIRPNEPDSREVTFRRGSNELLVRLHQHRAHWGLNIWLASKNPNYYEIRIRTQLFQRIVNNASVPARQKLALADQLAYAYERINDLENCLFWAAQSMPFRDARDGTRTLDHYHHNHDIRRMPGARDKQFGFFTSVFQARALNQEIRTHAARKVLELLLSEQKLEVMATFLDRNQGELSQLMPVQSKLHRVRLYVKKGDQEAAARIIKRLETIKDIGKHREFRGLRNLVNDMKRSTTQLEIDWDLQVLTDRATKLASEKDERALNRMIRDVLRQKNASLVETKEARLLAGAGPVYRKTFGGLSKSYQESLNQYLTLLRTKAAFNIHRLRRQQAQLSLRPLKQIGDGYHEALPERGSLTGLSDTRFRPIVKLSPGVAEMTHSDVWFQNRVPRIPQPAGACAQGVMAFVQNSREIVALQNGAVMWHRRFPVSKLLLADRPPAKAFSGVMTPVADKQTVYARIVDEKGFSLVALATASGGTRWTLSDQDFIMCSDPTLWNGQLLVVTKRPDVISRYFLTWIDARSGKVLNELFLFASQESVQVANRRVEQMQLDLFLPRLALDGGLAYLCSNYGVAFCIDLNAGSFVWARKYPRAPFAVDSNLTKSLANLRLAPPVVGRDNVLFAAADSRVLMLVNKKSGRLAKERLASDWAEVRGVGANGAVIIDKKRGARLVSLSTLADQKRIKGTNYRYVGRLKDAVVLSNHDGVVMYSERGKLLGRSKPMHQTVPILLLHQGNAISGCVGYRADQRVPVVGGVGAWANNAPRTVVERKELGVTYLGNPKFQTYGEDRFILADNYVCMLGDKLQDRWAFPTPYRIAADRIKVTGDQVFIAGSRDVWVLDKKTGKQVRRYPEPGDMQVDRFEAPTAGTNGDLLVYEIRHGERRTQVLSLSAQRVDVIGWRNGHARVWGISSDGQHVVHASQRHEMRVMKLRSGNKEYRDTKIKHKLRERSDRVNSFTMTTGKSIIYHPYMTIVTENDRFVEVKHEKWRRRTDRWMWEPRNRAVYTDCFAIRPYPPTVTMIDARRKKDLSSDVRFYAMPVEQGDLFYGLAMPKQKNMSHAATAYNRRTGKTLYYEHFNVHHHLQHAQHTASVVLGDQCYHLFKPAQRGDLRVEDCLAVTHASKGGAVKYLRFPGFGEGGDAIAANGYINILMDGRPWAMSEQQFLKFTGAVAPIVTTAYWPKGKRWAPEPLIIDGYPDEWDLTTFTKIGKNSFYCMRDPNYVYLAGEIKDEALIQSAGRKGLDGRLQCTMMLGTRANFRKDTPGNRAFNATLTSNGSDAEPKKGKEGGVPWRFSYSVSPAGDSCFFEMKVPAQQVFGFMQNQERDMARSPVRDIRGDMAFAFTFNDNGRLRGLYSKAGTLPVSFPRVKFEPVNEKFSEKVVLPTATRGLQQWKVTYTKPPKGWEKPGFNDASWKSSPGAFAGSGMGGRAVRSPWSNSDIWIRTRFQVKDPTLLDPTLEIFHDDDARVYINGVLAAKLGGFTTTYKRVPISREAANSLKKGKNTIAIHCHQGTGGQYIDAGLIMFEPRKK